MPLHLACGQVDIPTVNILMDYAPELVVNGRDGSGWMVMHCALTSGDDDLADWLSSQPVVAVGVRDKHGGLPAHFAAACAPIAMLDSFSRRFPSRVWATDHFGYTLLHMAVVGVNLPSISYLLGDVPDVDSNAQNK